MKAPRGVSGSPLLNLETKELVGMVWGFDWGVDGFKHHGDYEGDEGDFDPGANAYTSGSLITLIE